MVEDCEDEALLLTHELERAANDVCWRRVDSPEAMETALDEAEWDLVISDHAMPRFSSEDAYNLVKRCGKDIPFIIYSGHINESAALSAMAMGVHDFVEKGNVRRLLPVVRREMRTVAQARARARAENRLHRVVNFDQLTGLPSRYLFYEQAKALLAQCGPGNGATLLFLDVDRFMRINNTFGYAVGDQLVRQVAVRLQETIGGQAVVTRFGHDDFALLEPEARTPEEARALAERIAHAFGCPFRLHGREFFLTLSIGGCCFPQDGEDIGRLLVNAESAMFLAKRAGRNNYQRYVRDMNSASAERLEMETNLRHAVHRKELMLHYQPSVDLASGRITGVEALVRWAHPVLGMIPPDKFIPIADETGLISEIGAWVLFEACAQSKRWHDKGMNAMKVSVNVSAVQFKQGDLTRVVAEALEKAGLPPACLDLEITETVLMQEADATIAILKELKAMGVCISVDDFGTGYSSLAYLKRFPIDTLKIDKSFMRDVTSDSHNAAIVRTVIALAKSLGLESIAEGVETREQLDFLRAEGCNRMQGYYYSRPLAPQALYEFVHGAPRLD
ncbi:MAG: GGDEF and EAL domain-containing protein [Betaproteobacteria bacterium]|nr:MAG: GGDEF and EAL domain-containing protein [Betaproteobacteria bacterium]